MRLLIISIAIAALISSATAVSAADGDAAKGKQTYQTYCSTCHGPLGDGLGPVGKTLKPPPRDFTKGDFAFGSSDQEIFDVISNGAAVKGGSPLMAPWGAVIPEADRWNVVAFIRSLKK
jgi:mono/diheme cytochrome c family protein